MGKKESLAGRGESPPRILGRGQAPIQPTFQTKGREQEDETAFSMSCPTLRFSGAGTGPSPLLIPQRGLQLRSLPPAPFRYTPQGHSPGSGDSSGGGPCAQGIAQGEAAPGRVSQSASGHSPPLSPVPAGSGHRLGEIARHDSLSREQGPPLSFHSSIPGLESCRAHSGCSQCLGSE